MRLLRFLPVLLVIYAGASAQAQSANAVAGDWRTPGGAVVRIAACGTDLCATLVRLEPNAPGTTDVNNPDPALRTHSLCGARIGYGFHLRDADHAEEGHLYDPKSGKTYKGMMTREGDHLLLRGYIGVKAFGRTESWTRSATPPGPCP